jgi:hypothetical protein
MPVLAARRSRASLLAIVAVIVMVLLLAVLAGGYAVLGNAYASSRSKDADGAIASIHKVDFTTALFQISGGFNVYIEAKSYQASVKQFVASIDSDATGIAGDAAKAKAAQSRLNDSPWLTLLSRSTLDRATARLGHAQKALDGSATIASDMAEDGRFFEAYAASLVDLENYAAAVKADDGMAEAATIGQTKSDLAIALTVVDAPGLPSGVREFITSIQTVAADIAKAINSADQKTYDAAVKQIEADETALVAIDTSGFDAAIQSFYQPLIATYAQELQRASD